MAARRLGGELRGALRAARRTADRRDRPSRRRAGPLAQRRNGDVQLLLALQDRLCARSERQPAIGVGAQRIARDQCPRDRPHQRQFLGVAIPNTDSRSMAEAAHLLIVVAGQHVGEMPDAEAHLGAERGGQQLARDLGRVDGCGRVEAIVAIAAALPAGLRRNGAAGWRGGRRPLRQSAASALSRSRSPARRSGSTSLSIRWRARAKSSARPEQPRLGGFAVAARRGRSPGNRPRWSSGWRHARRSGRRACRCPCRRRRSRRSPSLRNATNAAWLRARTCGSSPA